MAFIYAHSELRANKQKNKLSRQANKKKKQKSDIQIYLFFITTLGLPLFFARMLFMIVHFRTLVFLCHSLSGLSIHYYIARER